VAKLPPPLYILLVPYVTILNQNRFLFDKKFKSMGKKLTGDGGNEIQLLHP